jgi:hypothetical protein
VLLAVPAAVSDGALAESGVAEALMMGTVLFLLLQTLNSLWSVVPASQLRRALTTGVDK